MAFLDKTESGEHKQQMHMGDSVAEKLVSPQTPTQPEGQIPQSDSGICLTPLSQASALSPQQTEPVPEEPASVVSVYQTETVPEVLENSTEGNGSGHLPPSVSFVSPADSASASLSPPKHDTSHSASMHQGSIPDSDSRIPTPDHSRISPRACKFSSSQSPDDFTYQTKYLVLQFLHQSTTEQHLLPLSHNSLSTTSESEPRFKSYAERLRKQWQTNKSLSSPTSPQPRTKPKPSKMKGSKSSPNLKDANFFKDMPPHRKPRARETHQAKTAKGGRKSSNLPRMSPVQTVAATDLIRSVSENTENSETGTNASDADDELDTSFDSSHQGSATSVSLRNRMAHYHHQAFRTSLPTVQSETESVAEMPLNVAEESVVADMSPLPIMDLNADSVDHAPVLTVESYTRVTDYLDQLRGTEADRLSDTTAAHVDAVTVQQGGDGEEADIETVLSQPFIPHPDEQMIGLYASDHLEDGALSGGFEPDTTGSFFPEETEGACGGVGVDDLSRAGDDVEYGQRADRSRLRLDIHDQDTVVLIEAVHSLRHDIEEEISSFESELEEAMQSHQSDCSWSHGLSHSQSVSPETMEIARRLARIGDEVQQKYFDHLERAVGQLFLDNCAGLITYENFREAAMMALDADLHGWNQVATVLLYSQHVALHLARSGRRTLHKIIDYTVRLLADTAAEFIINQGGWRSISSIDHSSTPSSPELPQTVPPSFHGPGSIVPPTQESLGSRRSQSAPNLHTAPPGESHHSPASSALGGPSLQGAASASRSASSVGGVFSEVPASGRKEEDGGEKAGRTTEGEAAGTSAASAENGNPVISTSVLTGCAVSVALIGVGVAVALRLIRG